MFNVRLTQEFPFPPTFFAKPPFRSYYFVCATIFLVLILSLLGVVTAKHWSLLSAFSVYWLGLVGFSIVALWSRALSCYRRIHEILESEADGLVRDDSPFEVAMSSAAGMTYYGLFFAGMIAMGLLIVLGNALSHR